MSDAKIRAIVKRPDEKYGHVMNDEVFEEE